MSELENPFFKISDQKNFLKKRKSMSKCRMSRKKTTSEKWKFGSYKKLGFEWTMNGLGQPFRKKIRSKNQKTVKIKVKLLHVNKKPLAGKWIFVPAPFSHSALNLERKNFTPQNYFFAPLHVSAWSKSLLQFDFKIHENVWTDLKKDIPGRNPETTRSGNPFKNHPFNSI